MAIRQRLDEVARRSFPGIGNILGARRDRVMLCKAQIRTCPKDGKGIM